MKISYYEMKLAQVMLNSEQVFETGTSFAPQWMSLWKNNMMEGKSGATKWIDIWWCM